MEKKYEIWVDIAGGCQGIYVGDVFTDGEKCGKSCQFYREVSDESELGEYSSCQLNGAKFTVLKDVFSREYENVFCWRSDFCKLITEAMDEADKK